GAITAGQVFCEDIDYYPKVDILSNELLNPDSAYAKYRKEVKVMTRRQVEATAMALFNISNFIMQKIAYGKIQQELLLYQKQQIELEHKLKLAELDALHKQVTPHFIFSVINSVSRLIAMQEYCTADKMLSSFAQMLRYSLSNIQANVSLLQELNYIENYLAIQQMRFVKQIRYQIDCDSALAQMQVPFFSLQPLVENSIVHGLLNLEKGGELKLRCSHKSDYDEILLSDNGIGIDAAHLEEIKLFLQRVNIATPGNHVGIYNSYQRFRLLYQDRFDFEINSIVNIGTTIHIRIRRNL
ncbi:MAG: histidine kinase, partial [Synergistaceae bacterium]|nr:histidine kinase [Synergistaceae bacterium]